MNLGAKLPRGQTEESATAPDIEEVLPAQASYAEHRAQRRLGFANPRVGEQGQEPGPVVAEGNAISPPNLLPGTGGADLGTHVRRAKAARLVTDRPSLVGQGRSPRGRTPRRASSARSRSIASHTPGMT